MRFARHWALSGAPRIGNLRNWLFVPGTPTVFRNRLSFVLTLPIEAGFCVFEDHPGTRLPPLSQRHFDSLDYDIVDFPALLERRLA